MPFYFLAKTYALLYEISIGGKPIDRSDQPAKRWGNVFRIALGQSKMVDRPISGILHIIVYVGFVVINIELIEIVLDGLLGTIVYLRPIWVLCTMS